MAKAVGTMAKQKNKPVKKAPINKRIGRAILTNLETNEAREIDNNEFLEILNRNPSSRIKFRDVVMSYAPEGGTVGYRDTIDGVKYLVDVYGEPSEPLWASVRKSATKSSNDTAKKSQPTDDELFEIEDMIDDLIDELIYNGEGKLSDDLFDVLRDFHEGDYEYVADVIHGIGNDSSSSEISEKADEISERVRRCSKSTKKSQPTVKSFNDMVKTQRNKNLKKTYPEDLTDEQAQTVDGYRLWANSIGEEIWNVVRSVTGLRSRSNMELDSSWKEVSDLLIQAKEKADALVNVEIELR